MAIASVPDLLRLVAVPVLGWAAYRDVQTRRVPNRTWAPLVAVGSVLLVRDAWVAWTAPEPFRWSLFALPAAVSLGVVVPLAYLFWRTGGFGGADAKALMALALLFPTYPAYIIPGQTLALPVVESTVGAFSLTVLTNTVIVGLASPLALVVRNAVAGRFSPLMAVGRPVAVERLPGVHGRLLETPAGATRSGLDLDALRMYLRWRGASLSELRAEPERMRDPSSLPAESNPVGDGAVRSDGGDVADAEQSDVDGDATSDASTGDTAPDDTTPDDPWGAAAFLDSLDGDAYGTTPEGLQDGLDVVAERDAVWVSPGMPFVVPLFVGLVVALTYGDVLFAVLRAVGVV